MLIGENYRNRKTVEGRILKKLYVKYANEAKATMSSIFTKDEEILISFLGNNAVRFKDSDKPAKPKDMEDDYYEEAEEENMDETPAFKLKEKAEKDMHIFED